MIQRRAFLVGMAALSAMHPLDSQASRAASRSAADRAAGSKLEKRAAISGLSAVRKLTEQYSRDWEADGPGFAIGVFQQGELVYGGASGRALLENDQPFALDTVCCVGSVSKQFTAFAIHLLVGDGKLQLDADVRTLLPYLQDEQIPVTVSELLNHTGGWRDPWGYLPFTGLAESDAIDQRHFRKWMAQQRGRHFLPGMRFEYNNGGYVALADLVEIVSGQSFGRFLAGRVFGPLKMSRTTVKQQVGQLIPHAARSYRRRPTGKPSETGLGHGWDERASLAGGPVLPVRGWDYVPLEYASYGTSNVWSTIDDLGRWLSNLADPIEPHATASRAMWESGRLASGEETRYGSALLRVNVGSRTAFHHGGHDQDFEAMVYVFPDEQVAIAGIANATPDTRSVSELVMEAVETLFWGTPLRPDRRNPQGVPPKAFETRSAVDIADAAGVYMSEDGIAIRIGASVDSLVVERHGTQSQFDRRSEREFVSQDGQISAKFARSAARVQEGYDEVSFHFGARSSWPTRAERYVRVREAKRLQPGLEDGLAGRYFSDELSLELVVTRQAGTFVVTNPLRLLRAALRPLTATIFCGDWPGLLGDTPFTLRFDPESRPSRSFEISAPSAYSLRFLRRPEA